MCGKKPAMPQVQTVDVEAQQREAEVKASQRAQQENNQRQQRRQRSALDRGRGSALSLYGGGSTNLGGR